MRFHHSIQMATEYMQEAFKLYRAATETYRLYEASAAEPEKRSFALYRFAEVYEEQADKYARLADEYFTEAECHNWAKRG